MAKHNINKDNDFLVRESTGLNFIVAIFFWIVLISVIYNYLRDSSSDDNWLNLAAGLIAITVAVVFTLKGLKRKICIRINHKGFFYHNTFITDWPNLESAEISQSDKIVTIQDNFILILKYYKEGKGSYVRKIPLTNTQNRSEEEILAAVKYYHNLYR